MLDSIIFERLGVPSVPIVTAPFRPTAVALAELQGFADYRFVTVDHPITSLDQDQLQTRACFAAPFVEAALLGRPEPTNS